MTITLVLVLIALCVLLETIEQICYRFGGRRGVLFIIAGCGANLLGMVVWLLVLRHASLSQAVPALAASNITIVIAGRVLFGERVTRRAWIGIALITAGVAIVSTAHS